MSSCISLSLLTSLTTLSLPLRILLGSYRSSKMIFNTLFKAVVLGAAAVSAVNLEGVDVVSTSPSRVFKFGCKCVCLSFFLS